MGLRDSRESWVYNYLTIHTLQSNMHIIYVKHIQVNTPQVNTYNTTDVDSYTIETNQDQYLSICAVLGFSIVIVFFTCLKFSIFNIPKQNSNSIRFI